MPRVDDDTDGGIPAKDLPPQSGDTEPVLPVDLDTPRWGQLFGRKRQERLAVNLCDLDRVDPFIRGAMRLAEKLDLATGPFQVDRDRFDETYVAFRCSLLDAACLLDVLRMHDRRAKESPTRCCIRRERAWTRLPGSTVLTVVVGGEVRLDPSLFPGEQLEGEPVPVKKAVFE